MAGSLASAWWCTKVSLDCLIRRTALSGIRPLGAGFSVNRPAWGYCETNVAVGLPPIGKTIDRLDGIPAITRRKPMPTAIVQLRLTRRFLGVRDGHRHSPHNDLLPSSLSRNSQFLGRR
jgi:hypothetical protein